MLGAEMVAAAPTTALAFKKDRRFMGVGVFY
jgi:hypothetical protein